jgi:Ser/Thr protein kinase RdoA (MazF antagonist)
VADAWDSIVGIPLDDWRKADTPEQIHWLTWLRDHPMPAPPPGDPIAEVYTFAGAHIHTIRAPR